MSARRFWTILFAVTAGTLLLMGVLEYVLPSSEAFSTFTFTAIAAFVLIIAGAYFLAKRAVASSNQYSFIHLVMALILVKMLVCILLVAVHMEAHKPESKLFVLPFLLVYLIFTTFEVIALERVAKTPRDDQQHSNS